jgi:hypothetical protein
MELACPWVNDELEMEAIMQKGYFIPVKGMARLGIDSPEKLNDREILKKRNKR